MESVSNIQVVVALPMGMTTGQVIEKGRYWSGSEWFAGFVVRFADGIEHIFAGSRLGKDVFVKRAA